jgi:hypothetical protein
MVYIQRINLLSVIMASHANTLRAHHHIIVKSPPSAQATILHQANSKMWNSVRTQCVDPPPPREQTRRKRGDANAASSLGLGALVMFMFVYTNTHV